MRLHEAGPGTLRTTLTGLTDALERLGALVPGPVAPTRVPPSGAVGHVLAAPLAAAADLPPVTVAAHDGVAVRADELHGAGPYAPVVLVRPALLAQGEPLPPGTDAVVAARAVAWRGETAELSCPVAPGEGVLAAGHDIGAGTVWRPQGAVLSRWDLPLLAALAGGEVLVRIPRVALLPTGARIAASPGLDVTSTSLAALLATDGATVQTLHPVAGRTATAEALLRAASEADLVIMTGGCGHGAADHAAAALADAGVLAVHGIGLRPGTTSGFGAVGGTLVILLPGRPVDALGTWLVLGAPVLRCLAGAPPAPTRPVRLARKLVSTPGVAELALLRGADAAMNPLAVGEIPLAAFARAHAFLIVPAASEGYNEGTVLDCRDL